MVRSGEEGALLMIELGMAVLRPPGSRSMPVMFTPGSISMPVMSTPGSISMPVTFAVDVQGGEGKGDWIGEGAGVSPQDGEQALGGDAEGCLRDGDQV